MSSGAGAISLPSGGGALQGIGEKFSADLHTGTGNFTVPIALPPGRNGFQPDLSLAYSTGTATGRSGSVGASACRGSAARPPRAFRATTMRRTRSSSRGPRTWYPSRRRAGCGPATVRAPRACSRASTTTTTADDYWEVRSKDGLVSIYGDYRGGRGAIPRRSPTPTDRGRVFAWKLTRDRDPFGNRIDYEYERDAGERRVPPLGPALPPNASATPTTPTAKRPRFLVSVALRVRGPARPLLRPPRRLRDPHHASGAAASRSAPTRAWTGRSAPTG